MLPCDCPRVGEVGGNRRGPPVVGRRCLRTAAGEDGSGRHATGVESSVSRSDGDVLLVQRAARDDRRCRRKYGELWKVYCAKVPFRMLPLIY
ncbi:MAG: hypothetical protein E2O73_12405 [Deltaproteobacteria bacterium]|nr:MAG: hypothetical protein E2O73_12405 [Deltaproteobacteria bacterium]